MLKSDKKIVLSADIEYRHLHLENTKRFGESKKEKEYIDELKEKIRITLKEELPADIKEILNLKIDTDILLIKEGSLVVFFSVFLASYVTISRYKNFYESIILIRDHARLLLEKITTTYDPNLRVRTSIKHPSSLAISSMRNHNLRHRNLDDIALSDQVIENIYSDENNSRDGFFWYLVIANIILIAIVLVLTYSAVSSTYFQ